MKIYAALEERDLVLGFHAGFEWRENAFKTTNRFISVHALGFCFHNMLHVTNWIVNGLPERFPKLKVLWMESGLAWVPFLMQRLDNEYMMRTNEAPALTMLPSDYMRKMYFTTQPMERVKNAKALANTFEMMNAETQLMYSSDYPHWDFDLPSCRLRLAVPRRRGETQHPRPERQAALRFGRHTKAGEESPPAGSV